MTEAEFDRMRRDFINIHRGQHQATRRGQRKSKGAAEGWLDQKQAAVLKVLFFDQWGEAIIEDLAAYRASVGAAGAGLGSSGNATTDGGSAGSSP